jgi:hypothetical protein
MKNKILLYLPSIIFSVVEIGVIALIGMLLNLKIETMIIIFVLFAIIRTSLGGAMHYKDWYKCMIWSALVFLSLFVLAKANIIICILMTIFCACILTKRGNISDIFMWKGKATKYADVDEYIKYHLLDDKLIEFEKKIQEQDKLDYLIYKYRFKDNLTFEQISDKLDIGTPRVSEKIEKIAFAIRLYCGI